MGVSPSKLRSFPWFGFQGRALFNQAQGFSDGAFQLRVAIVGIVLRSNIDLDIGVGTVVLDIPAHVLEPESELWLRGRCTIDQFMTRVDANDAAPGTFPNERA